MATDAEMRTVLAEHGVQVSSKGRLGRQHREAYEDIMGELAPDAPVADIDAGPAEDYPDDPPPREPLKTEQKPRVVRADGASAAARARKLWDRGSGKGGGKKAGGARPRAKKAPPRPEQPWRSTRGVIESVWSRAAWAAAGIPPLQRILAAQAPMAGIVLEGKLRGKLPDRIILQPLARVEESAEAATAMIGVPAMVALISFRGGVVLADTPQGPRPVIGPDGVPVWDDKTKVMISGLKFCLASWLEISHRTAADVKASATRNLEIEQQADELVKWIFGPPDPGQSWNDVQAEAREKSAAYTDAAGPGDGGGDGIHDDVAPREQAGAPGPPPSRPSSAFAPALTASVLPG